MGDAFNNASKVKRAEKKFKPFACKKIQTDKLFKKASQEVNPDTINWYCQRGHLFPDQDAPVFSWKEATYSFGNWAPQSNVSFKIIY